MKAKQGRVGSGEKGVVASLPSLLVFFALVFSNSAFPTISEPGTGLMVYGMTRNGQGRFEDFNVFVFHFFAKFFHKK